MPFEVANTLNATENFAIDLVENDDVDEEDCGQEASRDQAELHQLRGRKARMMEDADWSENDHVEECGALIGQLVSWLETRGHPQYPLPTSFQHRSEYLHKMAT